MSEIAREARTLRSELEQVKREMDLATSQLLMVGSEIGGDPKLDPKDQRDPRWTPTLEEAAKLRTDNERLRGALERLMLSRDASWTGGHDWEEALDEAAAALAGEGEAKRCTWTYDETHCAWDSSCGEKWILEDGGPNENRIRFCHGCGKPVEAKAWEEEVEP